MVVITYADAKEVVEDRSSSGDCRFRLVVAMGRRCKETIGRRIQSHCGADCSGRGEFIEARPSRDANSRVEGCLV